MIVDQPPLIKPCVRFSRTRLSDVLHRRACALFQPSVVSAFALERVRQPRHEGGCPLFGLDVLEGDAVNAGAAFVGADKVIGVTEDVGPVNLVVQGVEAAGGFLLGLAVQLPL